MNLLTDPLFRVRVAGATRHASLPGLLALLGEDQVESLPGLQRHQEDALHIFLCYLAGAVLDRQGRGDPRQPADFWCDGIRALTAAEGCPDDAAWILVVEDPTRPAFLQPPAPSQEVFTKDYKPKAASPDALDVLQTAKNHDVKAIKGAVTAPEAWAYALISQAGTCGYNGAGNYGIARMNGGFGSRVSVGWRKSWRAGHRFLSDTRRLLSRRHEMLDTPFYSTNGKVLLWTSIWQGTRGESFSLIDVDPFFIDAPRRLRLTRDGCLSATSQSMRINADMMNGDVGDAWTPTEHAKDGKQSWTPRGRDLSPGSYSPDSIRKIIFGDDGVAQAPMQMPTHGTEGGWITLNALVRERRKGNPDGFHEAAIRIPEKARPVLFGKGPARDRLATLSSRGLKFASDIQYRVLQPALYALMEGGPVSINLDKREVSDWVGSAAAPYYQSWHPLYFDWLWSTLDQPDESAALKPWFERLRNLAESTLEQAFQRVPLRSGRNYRAKTNARRMFYGSLKKHFADYLEANHEQP